MVCTFSVCIEIGSYLETIAAESYAKTGSMMDPLMVYSDSIFQCSFWRQWTTSTIVFSHNPSWNDNIGVAVTISS